MRRTLELFGGAGGLAEGFRRAGISFDVTFDFSKDACDSYEQNLRQRPIQCDVRDLLRLNFAGWSPRDGLDLLTADPPCTPWSRAGKRQGLADERDMLRETAELIRQLKPTAFLIGNIPGLDDSSNTRVVQGVIGALWRDGYAIDYRKLDAADYGVPQNRVRPFWFGRPRESARLAWPAPTHCNPERLSTIAIAGAELAPWATCRQALEHVPVEEMGRVIRIRAKARNAHPPSSPDEPARVLLAEPSRLDKGGAVLAPWPWPSTVITADLNGRIPPRGRHGKSRFSQGNAIALSERAAKILQGFPESWVFSGATKAARWAQIGTAVPPPLAEALGRSIARWFAAQGAREVA
ncbi:MAG TPA: DNA cytosine methyltransferase [Polyangiaceae bacterium]|nr:DNA cytosine methyltransferase [Polyangiaceae bacterium]